MLRNRAGFTLVEVIVALVLTAVVGAAITSVFISQSKFYDQQEKLGFARGVSRGAMNMMMSELRMLEQDSGIVSAATDKVTVRAPYALGLACDYSPFTVSVIPSDTFMYNDAKFAGYAYRLPDGRYHYVASSTQPSAGSAAACDASPAVGRFPASEGGRVLTLSPAAPSSVARGTPVLLWQLVTYAFRNSEEVPGRLGLWREIDGEDAEEMVAPFDSTAGFRFYVDDGATPQSAAPSDLSRITGLELILDGLSERPSPDGTFRRVPLSTAVFFRNRR
jgi:prepilin-type N-terminal cleavage/methylation domain-containing protein